MRKSKALPYLPERLLRSNAGPLRAKVQQLLHVLLFCLGELQGALANGAHVVDHGQSQLLLKRKHVVLLKVLVRKPHVDAFQ